jgi:hypothetical protein
VSWRHNNILVFGHIANTIAIVIVVIIVVNGKGEGKRITGRPRKQSRKKTLIFLQGGEFELTNGIVEMQDDGNVTGIRKMIPGHYNHIFQYVVERYLSKAQTLGDGYIKADERCRRERCQK